MALSANSVWEVRPTNGSNTNGGGFVAGASGTDFSQQNAKNTVGNNISTTDLVTTGIATVTSATASFTSAIVGNIIFLSGTGITTGWYQVVTFTNSTTVILDRSPGTGTLGTMNIGGALQTLGQLNTNIAAGHIGWVKAEATITVSSAFTWNFTSNSSFTYINGYTSTRGDNGQVTLQATSGTSYVIMTLNNNNNATGVILRNFILDCQSRSGVTGFSMQSNGCLIQNFKIINQQGGTAFNVQNNGSVGGTLIGCLVTSSDQCVGYDTTSSGGTSMLMYCAAIALTSSAGASTPFKVDQCQLIGCISGNNTGATTDGFLINAAQRPILMMNCIAYGNGRDGIRFPASNPSYPVTIINCLSIANTGFGINNPSGTAIKQNGLVIQYNATQGNTAGAVQGLTLDSTNLALSGDPTVAGASNNFALNNTAGAGAAARAAGFPGVFQTGGTGFQDIGALQHADPGGAGGMLYVPNLEGT